MRIVPIAWLLPVLVTPSLYSATWGLHPQAGLKAADVYLSTRNPADQYGSSFKALEGAFTLRRQDQASLWDSSVGLETAQANEASFGASSFKSRYTSRQKSSATNFDISYRRTHGFDPIGQPIEEAAVKDSRKFESLYAGVYHQTVFDPSNELSFFLGGGKNAEGGAQTNSRDAQISWDHHHSVAWTSRVRLRTTDATNKQREIMHEHLLRYDAKLSAEVSYGYGWQSSTVETSSGVLGGIALQYQTSGLFVSQSAYAALAPAKEISAEQTESLRGSSLYRLGWTHSRDQRRVGDPFYYADMFYGSARIELWGRQGLELKASHSRASAQRVLDTLNDYSSALAEAQYDWSHRYFTRFPDATLALAYSAERTELSPRRFFREIYQLRYNLLW